MQELLLKINKCAEDQNIITNHKKQTFKITDFSVFLHI